MGSDVLRDIDHLQLAMPEGQEQAVRDFYGGILKMREVEKPEALRRRGGLWFTLGDRQVHLGVERDFRPAGKAHPGFLVEDMTALRAALISAGYPIIDDEPLPGYEHFYSTDPFGNRLEFLKKL